MHLDSLEQAGIAIETRDLEINYLRTRLDRLTARVEHLLEHLERQRSGTNQKIERLSDRVSALEVARGTSPFSAPCQPFPSPNITLQPPPFYNPPITGGVANVSGTIPPSQPLS